MSRKLSALLLAMLVLAGAMSLKAVIAASHDGSVIMANGSAPVPPPLVARNGSAPVPPPMRNGSAPVPPPFRNGSAPVPPPLAQ